MNAYNPEQRNMLKTGRFDANRIEDGYAILAMCSGRRADWDGVIELIEFNADVNFVNSALISDAISADKDNPSGVPIRVDCCFARESTSLAMRTWAGIPVARSPQSPQNMVATSIFPGVDNR